MLCCLSRWNNNKKIHHSLCNLSIYKSFIICYNKYTESEKILKGAITMLQKNKEKQERKAKRKPVLRPCRFTKKTTYTRKKGRNRDE